MTDNKFDIFIAEDEQDVANILKLLLTNAGYTVAHAADGRQAMELIPKIAPPRLALLDIMMPHADGFQVLGMIRSLPTWKGVNVCMLTAKAQPEDIKRALQFGINAYIKKPFETDALLSRIKKLLAEVK